LAKNSATRATDVAVVGRDRIQAEGLNGEITSLTGVAGKVNGGEGVTPGGGAREASRPPQAFVVAPGAGAGAVGGGGAGVVVVRGAVGALAGGRGAPRWHCAVVVERRLGRRVPLNLSRKAFGRQVSLASPRSQTGRGFTELAYPVAASLGEGSHVVLVAGATP